MSRCVDAEFQRGAGGLRLNLNPGGAFLTHSTRKGFKQTKTARRRSVIGGNAPVLAGLWQFPRGGRGCADYIGR